MQGDWGVLKWDLKAIAIARRPGLSLDSESPKATDIQPKTSGLPKISQLTFLDIGTTYLVAVG